MDQINQQEVTIETLDEVEEKYNERYEIKMDEKSHQNDLKPVCEGCECYCCKNFSRAYIYHLLDVKEINATILLSMHNLMQYDKFINKLNQ